MSIPVTPVPAATIILVRDGEEGLEVLMSKKSKAVSFAANALVFPGGRVDDQDMIDAQDYEDVPFASYRLAAIRELAEECAIEYTKSVHTLIHFAHWVTPESRPKRYDTHFFIAIADEDPGAIVVDGQEIVSANWLRPKDLLEEAAISENKLVLATLMNLTKLSKYNHTSELNELSGNAVVTVTPVLLEMPEGTFMSIPETAGYGENLISIDRIRRA